ncbi:hypothetical protein NPIL_326581 [Nephila pilipes]|uniref:Uncharacterized protein n=1 Tax=Nephila pilipes TaxID=299642 RepID=A0A8X6NS42_NEPPI|nr:hypothetical protein NPIL_326581 [Nephila pilipes]
MCRTQVVPGAHRTGDPSPPRGAVWTLTDAECRWMRPLWKTPNYTTEPPEFFSFVFSCRYSSGENRRNLTSKIIFCSVSQSERSGVSGEVPCLFYAPFFWFLEV